MKKEKEVFVHEYFYQECKYCQYWKPNGEFYSPCKNRYFFEEIKKEYPDMCIIKNEVKYE